MIYPLFLCSQKLIYNLRKSCNGMKDLANKLFESREVAHMFHLKTESYAQHMALQGYYEGILEFIDELVEIYQGQYDLIGDYRNIEKTPENLDDFTSYFEGIAEYVKEARYDQLKEEDGHLQNIVDEILALTYKTVYKLKYLK